MREEIKATTDIRFERYNRYKGYELTEEVDENDELIKVYIEVERDFFNFDTVEEAKAFIDRYESIEVGSGIIGTTGVTAIVTDIYINNGREHATLQASTGKSFSGVALTTIAMLLTVK